MANGGLLTGLEPAVAIPHEHYGVAEVLLKRDFAQGCRRRRGSDFGQTRNGHRISPLWGYGAGVGATTRICVFTSWNSSMARAPRARPMPLYLKPPSSKASLMSPQVLIHTVPALMARATRCARSTSLVKTAAARP